MIKLTTGKELVNHSIKANNKTDKIITQAMINITSIFLK